MQFEQPIHFYYLVSPFYFPNRSELKLFIVKMLQEEGKEVQAINYIFCSDKYLLDLNKDHLNHDTYTDIITFELSGPKQALLADIYVSVERVRENAKIFRQPFSKELLRVMFHGALHLAGYKDKFKTDSELMRKMEDKWLLKYRST